MLTQFMKVFNGKIEGTGTEPNRKRLRDERTAAHAFETALGDRCIDAVAVGLGR